VDLLVSFNWKTLTPRVRKGRIRAILCYQGPKPAALEGATMRKVLVVVFTAVLIQLGLNYADACGDKTMRVKTSLRYYEQAAKQHPSKILIYSASLPPGKAVELRSYLNKIGHKAIAMDDVSSVKNGIRNSHYDLVLTNLAAAPELQLQVEFSTQKTVVVPVLLKQPKEEKAAAKQYKVIVKNPEDLSDFLVAVSRVMNSQSKKS
jgi:hypothetical protein